MVLPNINNKKKITVILTLAVFSLILLISIWFFFPFDFDNLPPKTPLKIARNISGLDIPEEVEIVSFDRKEQTLGGDYSDEIVIQLTPEQTEKLISEWEKKGYGKEPIPKPDPASPYSREGFIIKNAKESTIGFFRHYDTQKYWSDIALDISGKRLLIYDSSD